jgi:GT2 family glycosyltransferase
MNGPAVSVLVPTHQDAALLELALPVFSREDAGSVEVIVVNNDPTQSEEVRAVVGSAYPDATIIEMGYDSGFGTAMNAGIHASRGEFVLILNADVFLSPDYIAEMRRFFAEHPRAGCAGGKLYRYDLERRERTDFLDTAGVRLGRNRRPMARGEGQLDSGAYDRAEQVFGVDSAGLFARRAALESIRIGDEYFDSSFFIHKEDTDLCWRLRLAGWENWYLPQAVGAHARTSRGLGDRSYLAAIRAVHRGATEKSLLVQTHAMKNQWLLLLKNDDLSNLLRDIPFVLARELAVVVHNVAFAPRSLVAVRMVAGLLRPTLAKRRLIKRRQAISAGEMRFWLGRT